MAEEVDGNNHGGEPRRSGRTNASKIPKTTARSQEESHGGA